MHFKKLLQKAFLASVLFALLFASCDMYFIEDTGGGNSRTEGCLTILNLPGHISPQKISNVNIYNQVSPIALCDDYSAIEIDVVDELSSAKIPLNFNNSVFSETGVYYVSFDINIDAYTRFTVTKDDEISVSFLHGSGFFDINDIPIPDSTGSLTIFNLPGYLSPQKVSNVEIHNQVTAVAKCADYSAVEVDGYEGLSSVKIPLNFNNSVFSETGVYYISFEINIDVNTRYLVEIEDRISVSFFNGSGYFDVNNITEASASYITLLNLPLDTSKNHFSDIKVFNLAGEIANCKDANEISVIRNGGYATAVIPVRYSSNGDFFRDSGKLLVTFTINVDFYNSISFARADDLVLNFFNGSAEYDLINSSGFFEAELVNPSDTAAPLIKNGSSFDIDGFVYTVSADTPVNSPLPSSGCVIYLYAYRAGSEVVFEYSSKAPVYSKGRGGYYSDGKRALWKMLYIVDSGSKFLFKTYIEDKYPHFGTYVVSNSVNVTGFTASYTLSGANNPAPASVTLQPGFYLVKLAGAGGGGGSGAVLDGSFYGASQGGQGGVVFEILSLNETATFTSFAGSGGLRAPDPPSGSYPFIWRFVRNTGISNPTTGTSYTYSSVSGGGGGGGTGSFLYSPGLYLLIAGGGGGGSGASYLTPGGAGGAGGSIGDGGGGGAAGYLDQTRYTGQGSTTVYQGTFYSQNANGGKGGGANGGAGGISVSEISNHNGANGDAKISPNSPSFPSGSFSYGGSSAPGPVNDDTFNTPHSVSNTIGVRAFRISHVFSPSSGSSGNAAFLSGTSVVNGRGANAPALNPNTINPSGGTSSFRIDLGAYAAGITGSPGGNIRNASAGGGAGGGTVSGSKPSNGAAGSVTIYKIN